jgi:putative transcriptional regulator
MATKRKFKSDAFEATHSSASAKYKVGAIDKATMRSFDASWLAPAPPLKPQQFKKLRQRLRISQPVFARYLNTSESTIEKWETGAKQPRGMGSQAPRRGREAWPGSARLEIAETQFCGGILSTAGHNHSAFSASTGLTAAA